MVCDGEDLSTPDLIRRIGHAMNRRVRLLPIPVSLLYCAGALLGRRREVARLCGSLAVDSAETQRELQWSPPVSLEEGLTQSVGWYLANERSNGR
jgi:nucleoside-diphosphate-sugar epimerase